MRKIVETDALAEGAEHTAALKRREEMDPSFCWRMEDLFESDAAWEEAAKELVTLRQECADLAGTLAQGGEQLLAALQKNDQLQQVLENVYVYAMQRYHQDTGNQTYQQLSGRAARMAVEVSDALSWMEPEILSLPEEDLKRWLEEMPGLKVYRRKLQEILRQKPHVLSSQMESVLAKAGEMGSSPQEIFMAFNNADISFGTITGEDGQEQELTHGNFIGFMESRDRQVRKAAFEKLYQVYDGHKNMLAAAFNANLKQDRFFADMRHYDSTLAAALDGGNIPLSVYHELIEGVREHLPAMYRYVRLRRKLLGLDQLHMYDVYAPLVELPEKKYTFEEAKATVKEGLSVLGEDYLSILEEGFSGGWIDVYENKGKRSGAYSWGAYGTHPYVLLNFSGNLNSVFTLAHEMGHAIHSYYSDRTQPYPYAGYRIFVAEVASTCNEALLIRSLLDKAESRQERAYLINYFLDQFKGTLFRQTMFAEFELKAHERLAKEGALPARTICDMYLQLNRDYFGPDMVSDEEIALEWSRIPHFYTPFYVYQYATGFSAAIAISAKILKGEEGIVEKYKHFLSSGSSLDPIDLLKICGVDMTSTEPVAEAMEVFTQFVAEMETLAEE